MNASVVTDDKTRSEPASPPEMKKESLQDQVRATMARRGMSQKDLADETSLSRGVISQWLGGAYPHEGDVVPAMEAWLGRQGLQFIMTRNAARVFDACNFAVQKKEIALIIGPPGVGKTVGLGEFHRRLTVAQQEVLWHVVSPRIREHALTKILSARLCPASVGSSHDLLEDVVAKLKRRPVPLFFDEVNHFNVGCLEIIRYIYDCCMIPIVLCGSLKMIRTLSEPSLRFPELEQLQSRIGLQVRLETLAPKETAKFLGHHIEAGEEIVAEFQRQTGGVLRPIVKAVEKLKDYMTRNGVQTPTVEMVRDVFRYQFVSE